MEIQAPKDTPVGPQDFYVTLCHQLGLDPRYEFISTEGRPMKIVDGGDLVRDMVIG